MTKEGLNLITVISLRHKLTVGSKMAKNDRMIFSISDDIRKFVEEDCQRRNESYSVYLRRLIYEEKQRRLKQIERERKNSK